jgi:hypothetical protein
VLDEFISNGIVADTASFTAFNLKDELFALVVKLTLEATFTWSF